MTLVSGAVLGSALALSAIAPAQAAVVDLPFGPLSIGDYCRAKISSSAFIGFYESSGLRCYTNGSGGSLVYVGSGDPYQALQHHATTLPA